MLALAATAIACAQTADAVKQAAPRYARHYPEQGGGWGTRAGRYRSIAWVEDWARGGRDDSDAFAVLKAIPLSSAGAVTLSIGGEERFWLDADSAPGLARARPASNSVLLRSVVHGSLNVGNHARGYLELANGLAGGRRARGFPPNQRNDAVVLQAFGELHGEALGGTLGGMAGRMEFQDGPSQLITVRDLPNIRTPWNGARAYGLWDRFRVDLFDFDGIRFRRDAWGDTRNRDEHLRGVVAGTAWAPAGGKRSLFADAFWYGYEVQRGWGRQHGRDRRDIYGLYLHGAIGRTTVNASAVRETGHFGDRPVAAHALFVTGGYLLSAAASQPRLGIVFERASGGGAYDSGTLHDFNIIHGGTARIDFSNALSYTNAQIAGLSFSFKPAKPWTVSFETDRVDRVAADDAVYSTSGMTPYAGTQNVPGRRVGNLYRASATWVIGKHLTWQLSFDRLDAGRVLHAAGYGNQDFARSLLTLRY